MTIKVGTGKTLISGATSKKWVKTLLGGTMAEPVSALPNATPPATTATGQTVPWPKPVEPLTGSPEISGSNTEAAAPELSERLSTRVQESYRRVEMTILDMVELARRRFQTLARERPIEIVVGVAIASLLAGAAVRIWRSNHD